MEGSSLTQRRGECQLEEEAIQTDYLMELGARLALVWQIQRDREKEMKRIWFETRKMPSVIEENVRDVTNRPLTEFIAPSIDSLPPLAFTNRRPVTTMLHPPSLLYIRAQDAQRFIVFSYFVPETSQSAECPVATEDTADVSTGKREDLLTDIRLSSMLHQYLPHYFDGDSMPQQQTVECTTEVSVDPLTISNVEEEDRFYPYSLPPLAQRFIGNSCNVPETSHPAVSAKVCQVATDATDTTAGTATVKRENPWAARSLPSVLPPSLPPVFDDDFMPPEQTAEDTCEVSVATEATAGTATVDGVDRSAANCPVPMQSPSLSLLFDIDYKLTGEEVEGTTKCPVARDTDISVSSVVKEEFLTDKSPPAPATLPLSLPCTHDNDHKQLWKTGEGTTEFSVDTKESVVASAFKKEVLMGDKSPVLALPDANLTLETCNDEPPTPLFCLATKTPVRVRASIRLTEDQGPRPWTLETAKDYWLGFDTESEERSVKEEVSPREGLKRDADCSHSKSFIGTFSLERAETILGRMGFLAMNHNKKKTFLKMEKKEEKKKLNMKLKDDEKERKEMKAKEEEQKKKKKKEMKEREKEKKKVMKAEKKREKLEQEKREKERKEKEKAEKKSSKGLIKIHYTMMKDRIKKEKKRSEMKKREKAEAEFQETVRKIQEKVELRW